MDDVDLLRARAMWRELTTVRSGFLDRDLVHASVDTHRAAPEGWVAPRRGAHQRALRATDLDDLIDDDDDVAIAAITLAELTVGVELAVARQRPRRQSYVDEIAASIPVLPYDEPVALRHASLLVAVRRAGQPRGAHDLIIEATAAAAGRTVAMSPGTG